MVRVGILARLRAKPGKENEVQKLLEGALSLAQAEKQTQVVWLAGTIAAALLGPFLPFPFDAISVIVALVYLADVRPAVREISGGSRW